MATQPLDMDYKGGRGGWRASMAAMNARYGQGMAGTAVRHGVMESFGWNIEGWGKGAVNQGFLGWRKAGAEFTGGGSKMFPGREGRMGAKSLARVVGGQAPVKMGAGAAARGAARVAFGTAGRAIPLVATAYFAYEGYQQEGAWGAAKGIGESALWSAAIHYGMAAVGGTAAAAVLAPVAAIGAGIGGAYVMGEAGRAHAKGLRQMEMGQSDQMQAAVGSAGAATMRQRSLMALNNTHLNGRMALGNEGFLMHRSFA